ncbi:hypothetical protein LHJ74_16680 [Streptomyces sp. N2-109]|uniref:Lipoprotein n=1 Tax=Streptomyces gossypii TaxID=2883101 RepID=A0ABT2JUE8_9ACTN|nr:hypothetical protein [Streptomyces gossypii]MCT2591516.1 hypothetical protein [Streptomyces gossypii]
MRARLVLATLTLASCASLTVAAAAPAGGGHGEVGRDLDRARYATGAFFSEELAETAGYQRTDECVSSPEGGMGYHYLNPDNLGSTEPGKPAAVLYAPDGEGGRKMVALEYIVPDRDQNPETVEDIYAFGQRLKGPITNIPQLGVHYALHVWLWEKNPLGLFADWNPRVHCPADSGTDAGEPTP